MITVPYISIAEATEYLTLRLNSDAWFSASDGGSTGPDERLQALVTASRIISRLRFADPTILVATTDPDLTIIDPSQQLYPDIPDTVRYATAEIALSLLDGIDPDFEYEILQMTNQKYANVSSSYNREVAQEHILAGVPSVVAWRYLVPYLDFDHSIRLDRVS